MVKEMEKSSYISKITFRSFTTTRNKTMRMHWIISQLCAIQPKKKELHTHSLANVYGENECNPIRVYSYHKASECLILLCSKYGVSDEFCKIEEFSCFLGT